MGKNHQGFTLIEALVGSALVVIVFVGIFAGYALALRVVEQSRNKVIATTLANGEIEQMKNLPYASVGTVGGYPAGTLQPVRTTTVNNITFTISDRVDYVIDPTDGLAPPEDECPNDYKRAQVKVSWIGHSSGEVKLNTDIAPTTLAEECAEKGGILSISVFDAYGVMVQSPLIQVNDPTTGQTVKDATPVDGTHIFSLPPATYQIVVSKPGYSTDRTYGLNEIAIPNQPNPLALQNQLTQLSFSIDQVSSFSIDTFSPQRAGYFADSFIDQSKISELSNIAVSGGTASIATTSPLINGIAQGYLVSTTVSPSNLTQWDQFSFSQDVPAGTQIAYQVFYLNGGQWVLVPDTVLPGNSVGFVVSPIDLSQLSIGIYSQLRAKATLTTNYAGVSPILYDWQLSWLTSLPVPAPNLSFHMQGAKTIGKDAQEKPVYKYSQDLVSNAKGYLSVGNLEWDSYTFSVVKDTGLNIVSTSPAPQPIGLQPNTSMNVQLFVQAQNSLLVTVENKNTGDPVFAATVRVHNASLSYDTTLYTDENGQVYFIPLAADTYTIEVSAPAYFNTSKTVSASGYKSTIIGITPVE